jgi:hypothetical protein
MMTQLLAHIFGDYIMQSDWMAMNKSKRTWPCLVHILLYTSVFLLLTTSWKALLVIGGVHFILDRFPIIIRRLIWLKNHMGPSGKYVPFEACSVTGYYDNVLNEVTGQAYGSANVNGFTPRLNYVTVWLYIITDNFLHLLTNYLALTYLS